MLYENFCFDWHYAMLGLVSGKRLDFFCIPPGFSLFWHRIMHTLCSSLTFTAFTRYWWRFCRALSRVMNSVLQRFDGVSHLACELCIVHRIEVQVDIVQLDTWYLMRKHSLWTGTNDYFTMNGQCRYSFSTALVYCTGALIRHVQYSMLRRVNAMLEFWYNIFVCEGAVHV